MQGVFPNQEWSPRQPNSDDNLWRYIDFQQFLSILENDSLWFSSIAMFFDPFEGALPETKIEELADNFPREVQEAEEIVARLYEALKYTTFACCWHKRDRETAAMWELYRNQGKEVAIRTTVQDFERSLPDGLDVTTGRVNYENYDRAVDFAVNRVSPFFHKRPSFEHEREFRAVLSEYEVPDGARIDDNYVKKINKAMPPGRSVTVNKEVLIQELVVSPVAPDWLKPLVEDVIDTYGMDEVEIRESHLDEEPF